MNDPDETQAAPSLRELDLPPGFDSSSDLLEDFYVPALSRAIRYDRSVGYFRSSALSAAARGMARFINRGGTVRLLCGAEVSEADRDALLGKSSLDGAFATRLADGLVTADEVARRRLEVLAWLAQAGRLEVRIAIAIDANGDPVVSEGPAPYFHEKIGVLWDAEGNGVAFQGSVNESATAWRSNFEAFSVYTSWAGSTGHFSFWVNRLEEHWAGKVRGFRVYPLPQAAAQRLVSLAPAHEPDHWDPQEMVGTGGDAEVARFLKIAPRTTGAEGLAEATIGVRLYPHQRQVVERLAGGYPRSWLVADEVGLGKTISAGMALRRLVLAGEVRRALVLAPANVCRQWQDELFEKFGLWVPRLDGGRAHGAHPSDVRALQPGENPYAAHPLLIASSHFARRPAQAELILAAAPYDLVVIDEAHHARRQHPNEDRYRPGRLLALLDHLVEADAARALWLLSATPMQTAPVELVDLLRAVGLSGALAERQAFLRFSAELARDDESISWAWLDRALQRTPSLPNGLAEEAALARLRARLGPVDAERIARFGTGSPPGAELAGALDCEGRAALREWLRLTGPVGRHLTRHSRETLRSYREAGLIAENLAERDVKPVTISFSQPEQELYDRLDGFIRRLMEAHGARRGAGFVLTVYRRRLTSSWAAIRASLRKRLDHERLFLEEDELDDAEEAFDEPGDGAGGGAPVGAPGGGGGPASTAVDDLTALPLSEEELAEIGAYVGQMATVEDSKLDRLRADVDSARSAGHSMIVFSQFTDTLDYLRAALSPYRAQMATFSGAGGFVYREGDGRVQREGDGRAQRAGEGWVPRAGGGWVPIAKRDLVEAIRARQVTLVLATDAASEGLNLQACSWLVNYDMPWNPMRVEQRIGRIDRLGQERDVVHVRNYFVAGTVEAAVYAALVQRIGDIRRLVGGAWQPIVGATERTVRQLALRGPAGPGWPAGPGHAGSVPDGIAGLLHAIDVAERGGIELPVEDPLPIPPPAHSPVSLSQLRAAVVERFGDSLDRPGRPATFEPARVSRDPEAWVALGTYGHPELDRVLRRHGAERVADGSALVTAGPGGGPLGVVRADRSPPEVVEDLAALESLGPVVSLGEAADLAERVAGRAAGARRDRHRAVESARQTNWEVGVRRRFTSLVQEVLAAGCRVGDPGDRPGPLTVWMDLGQSEDGLQYLETFRDRLGIAQGTLIGAVQVDVGAAVSVEEWRTLRRRAGDRLVAMMRDYQERGAPWRESNRQGPGNLKTDSKSRTENEVAAKAEVTAPTQSRQPP